ncbi:hypothetical protein KI387_017568, partial [Taxus chinensis]
IGHLVADCSSTCPSGPRPSQFVRWKKKINSCELDQRQNLQQITTIVLSPPIGSEDSDSQQGKSGPAGMAEFSALNVGILCKPGAGETPSQPEDTRRSTVSSVQVVAEIQRKEVVLKELVMSL